MTELLDRAVARVRALPPETQDDLARLLLNLADEEPGLYRLSPEEEASLAESLAKSLAKSLAEAERGEFATEAAVEAIWAKHGL